MGESSKAVFLSYASQDAEAAKRICEAIRAAGVEVWFDQSELRGGDAWDAKIRKQIKECALFVPVISANTQVRLEGYFRREWRLAVDRMHDMDDDVPFLLPVVIDETPDAGARVPERFRERQWTRLRPEGFGGQASTFAERVKKLLAGEGERGLATLPSLAPRGTPAGPGDPPLQGNYFRRGLALVTLTVAVVVALGIWPPWRKPKSASPQPETQAASRESTAPRPLSEARQLAERARAMSLDKYDSTADDFAAADDMIKRALALDSGDAEIWATASQLNRAFQGRGFDRSSARAAAALIQAQRAVKLDPDSIDAQFALGNAERGTDPVAAEQIMRKILARQPDHAGALFAMSNLCDRQGKVDEALGYLHRVAAQPATAALADYLEFLTYFSRARFAEADEALRRSIAIQPSANTEAALAMQLLTWKGDADGAARIFATSPTSLRNEARTIWMNAEVHLFRRAPDEALAVLDRMPDDFIQDSWFTGPKAYFVGRAQALAGRPEAAQVAWESGLALVEARLKESPANRNLRLMHGELLALLGRGEEALRETRTVTELDREQTALWFESPVLIYAALGRADDALPLLAKFCPPTVGQEVYWPLTPALLRLDPLWDKLRGDARFEKLLTDAEAAEIASLPPRDWPKDPELKRAIKLLDSSEAITSDVALAEDLVKGVLAVRPTDAEATVAMGRVQTYYLLRGFDRSEDRFAQAKFYAERGLVLAPDEPEALGVMATYLYRRGIELPRAARLLRQAIALTPQNPLYYRMLDNVLALDPTVSEQEMIASARLTAERFPRDALVQYELARHYRDAGQVDEAEHYLELAIKLGPVPNAITGLARSRLFAHDDPAGMKALLDQLPEHDRGNDRAVFSQFIYASVTGQPEVGLDALRALPEPWMIDFDYTGPTSLLEGELLLMEGKGELARIRFAEAQAELGRHKVDLSRNFSSAWLEAWILMRLGRLDEARARNGVFFPELQRPFRLYLGTNWWFNPIPACLLLGEHAKALALMREAVNFQRGRFIMRTAFHLDPRMAPFRDDPEIQALLAEPVDAEPKK